MFKGGFKVTRDEVRFSCRDCRDCRDRRVLLVPLLRRRLTEFNQVVCFTNLLRFFPRWQVQILYDLAARNGSGQSRRATHPSTTPPGTRAAAAAAAIRETVPALVASEDTSRALKRLAQQAGDKMAAAASKTDFKEAALWRDRRDALLSTMRQLKGIGAGQEPAGSGDEVLATA